jgi:hypothetical protein
MWNPKSPHAILLDKDPVVCFFSPHMNFDGYPEATILDKDPFACKIFFSHIKYLQRSPTSFIATHETLDS